MADATIKWGVRLNRIEILDITPPTNVLQAMSEQKEAEQQKRAAIEQVASNADTLGVLQMPALQDLASAPNSKVVITYASAGLVGNAETLIQALGATTLPIPAGVGLSNGTASNQWQGPR